MVIKNKSQKIVLCGLGRYDIGEIIAESILEGSMDYKQ